MDKFEQKEMMKMRPIKNTWHDWLINCTSEPIRKSTGGSKDKIVRLFKKNTPKLSKSKTQNKKLETLLYQKRKNN